MFRYSKSARQNKLEGESPFWISFSDLMTALMTLFLLVMAVTLVAITKTITTAEQAKLSREKDIHELMSDLKIKSISKNVEVDDKTFQIKFGSAILFDKNKSEIKPDQASFLRSYIPILLDVARSPKGNRWIRNIVVEGFTDVDGDYLPNLELSLNRSKHVVCKLFETPNINEIPLNQAQYREIQKLFLVGGYSFNLMKQDKTASRRVEFKIEFRGVDDEFNEPDVLNSKGYGQCYE